MRIPRIVDQIFDRVISWIEFMLSQVPKSGPRGTHGWYNNKRSETWRLGLCLAEGYILSSEEGCGIACGVTQRPQKCPVRRERSGQPAKWIRRIERGLSSKRNAPRISLSRLADHRVCGRAVDFKPGGSRRFARSPDRAAAERGQEFLFPLTYICGDVFTEVYGYGASRRAIWLGFFAMALLAGMGQLAVALPPAPEWKGQEAYATVFSLVPRFAVASLVAYWAGEFTNSYTLAKLKLFTGGRWLWTRTVGSTVTGQAVDTAVIIVVAFAGIQPPAMLLRMVLSSYLVKVAVEVVATPVTYLVVGWLKRAEAVDAFDKRTNFNPFAWQGEECLMNRFFRGV